MTVEEQLRTLHGQLALIGELLEAVAVASPLRGGEGLSADAAHAASRLCRHAAEGVRRLTERLPVEMLNRSR